jgi:hypothetical protein
VVFGVLQTNLANMDGMMSGITKQRGERRREPRYRPGTSFASGKRQYAFAHGLRGEQERFPNVLRFKVGISGDNVLGRVTLGYQPDDGGDGNSESSEARNPPHLVGVDGGPFELHRYILALALESGNRQ